MKLTTRLLVASAAVGLAATLGAVALQQPASSHGAMQIPGSRTWLCYEDGLTATGAIVPNNPACAAAVAKGGTTPLYNWFAVLRSDGAGRTSGFIPDGQLCSAAAVNYDFSGFDLARSDWPVTHLTAGASMEFHYNKWAAHPGTFSLYVTKDGWDPNAPLTWSELESTPFSTAVQPPSVGNPGSVNSYYYWTGTLPQKTGRHIIYSVWSRSDSTETFYGCSDVTFDGGNGQVTGEGPGGSTGSPSPSPSVTGTASASASPTPSRTSASPVPTGTGCSAAYQVTSSWSGGFQGAVTVTSKGAAINGWTVTWTFTNGETASQAWNGTLSQSGTGVTVKNVSYNGSLGAGASTSFGFLGSGTPAASVSALTCTSS